VYKTKIKDVHELQECIVDELNKLDQHINEQVVGVAIETLSLCGCSLNIRCEHFLLPTFCVFYRVDSLTVCLLIEVRVMCYNV